MKNPALKGFVLGVFVLVNVYCFGQNNIPCPTCTQGAHFGPYTPSLTPNGNNTFGSSYVVQNLCGLNYVQGSVLTETRYPTGTGFPTTVAIAGLPAGFVVQQAYVYYGVSYTEATPPATSVSITNPALANSVIASTMIGQGGSVCWGETGTCSYRCDVTPTISGNGTYTIDLTGFANDAWEVDGVTLIIMYVDPAATYSGNMVIWDGLMSSIGGTLNYTGTGFTACTNSSMGNAFGLYGDMQSNVNSNQNTETFNGSTQTFSNNFWNDNVINTNITACQNSCVFNSYTNNAGDCWLWTAAGLYWQYATCTSCNAMTVSSNNVNPSCGNNDGSITLNVVGGTPPYTYTWTPPVSTTNSATGLSAGTYQIVVKDGACNVQTINVTLTMVSLNISEAQTNIACHGQTNGSANFTVGGGTPPYTYTWAPPVSTTNLATGLSAGSYTITIKDNVGCQTAPVIIITQPALLTGNVVTIGALCNGKADGSATVTAGGGTAPYTYAWSPAGGANPTASNLSAGVYTVTITDNNGCTATATGTVTQPTALSVNITGPAVLCIGATGTLTANVGGGTMPYTYAWGPGVTSTTSTASVSPAVATTYTANITDANGCTASADFTVELGTPLSVTVSGGGSVCSATSTSLCATVSGSTGGTTYLWTPGNLTTPCITVSPTSTTIYTVSISDNCGSDATTTVTISVNPLPTIEFNVNIYQGCTPLCVQFYNTTTITQGAMRSYSWGFGDGDTTKQQSPAHCYTSSGKYDVSLTATSDSGCSATLTKVGMLSAFSHPDAAFTPSPEVSTILAPTIQFTDYSTDKYGIVFWDWTFGDGTDSTSNQRKTSHTYQDTGRYCASLIVMNEHGCRDTTTNCLVINPAFNLYIPSAFSPNGDGLNDVFMAKGQYIKSFEMYIFDRWGVQLFHSTDINNGWNGTVGGKSAVAQEDVYVYKIFVTDAQNNFHSYVGNVNLIK